MSIKEMDMQLRKVATRSVAAIALTALMAAPALAATVTFDNILANWQNAQPADVVGLAYVPPPEGTLASFAQVLWGEPFGQPLQSAYDFLAATPPPINVDVPPSPSADFILGEFTHENNIILVGQPNSSITSVQLRVTTDIAVDGVDQGNFTFLFDFTHEETPNDLDPCPYGGANDQGVNINGCADRVTVTTAQDTANFSVDGTLYTVNIRGFEVGGVFQTAFLTQEEANNEAFLVANVTAVTPVPEPASLAVLGSALAALGGLGLYRRRRNAA
jgi:hypothetical protein